MGWMRIYGHYVTINPKASIEKENLTVDQSVEQSVHNGLMTGSSRTLLASDFGF